MVFPIRHCVPCKAVMSLSVRSSCWSAIVVLFHFIPQSSSSSMYFQAPSSPRSLPNHASRHVVPPTVTTAHVQRCALKYCHVGVRLVNRGSMVLPTAQPHILGISVMSLCHDDCCRRQATRFFRRQSSLGRSDLQAREQLPTADADTAVLLRTWIPHLCNALVVVLALVHIALSLPSQPSPKLPVLDGRNANAATDNTL